MVKAMYLGLTTNELAKIASDLESENASLRGAAQGLGELCDKYKADNDRLRELILDMLVDEARGHNDDDTYYEHVRLAKELRIEVHE